MPAPRIAYFNAFGGVKVEKDKFSGARRCGAARGWDVVPVPSDESGGGGIPALLAKIHPRGCIVECAGGHSFPPPRLFGSVPVVYLDLPAWMPGAKVSLAVSADDAAVAATALRELAANRPVAVAAVEEAAPYPWSRMRARAFRIAAAARGLPCRVFRARRGESPDAYAARLAPWLSRLPRPCGVFAVNDVTGARVAAACRALRLSIPREIALVGVDDVESLSGGSETPFTSIRIDFERMGFLAASMLAARMKGRPMHEMKSAASAAKENMVSFAPTAHTSFVGIDNTLNCGTADPSFRAPRDPSFHQRADGSVIASVGPLMAVRRKSTTGRGRHEKFVEEALGIIRREAAGGLTPRALAARFDITRRLFDMRFREATGHSALDEITHVRLEKACELLSRTETPVTAVADFCGFGSYQAADWLFRKRFGLSMGAWRAANAALRP